MKQTAFAQKMLKQAARTIIDRGYVREMIRVKLDKQFHVFLDVRNLVLQNIGLDVVINKKHTNLNLRRIQAMQKRCHSNLANQEKEDSASPNATTERQATVQHLSTSHQTKGKKKYWNQIEHNLFVAFWLRQIIKYPYQAYTFKVPFKREIHFQELSSFLFEQGKKHNLEIERSAQQCRSRYNTINRMIRAMWTSKQKSYQFDFIDYFLQQAQKIKDPQLQLNTEINQIKNMRQNTSELMKNTHEMCCLEYRVENQSKNQAILAYLKEKKCKLPLWHIRQKKL